MIELKVDGVCKECPWRDLRMFAIVGVPETVTCTHRAVCKFIGDPVGKERLDAAVRTLEERNTDE